LPAATPVRYNVERRIKTVTPETTVQVISGVLALVCVALIVLRRRAKKKAAAEDEF